MRITGVNTLAGGEGLVPGITVAEARALVPHVLIGDADPEADAEGLLRLADWCRRWSPRVALDGPDGLILDITGCGHLWGGDGALLTDLSSRLDRASVGYRLGTAPTPAAAWAWSRYRPGRSRPMLGPEQTQEELNRLPVEALRIPMAQAANLGRVGLRIIGDLVRLPRAPLAARFGQELVDRLDRLTGAVPDPVTPLVTPPSWSTRLALAEPISRREDFELATGRLLAELCERLGEAGQGVRALTLTLYRVDGATQPLAIGTSKPSRDPRHLLRLFRERLDQIEPGFGVEVMTLEATETNRLAAEQVEAGGNGADLTRTELIDRLRTRAGNRAALRFASLSAHVPERTFSLRPVEEDAGEENWQTDGERPVLLLSPPEPINTDGIPVGVPEAFYWRGRRYHVGLHEGPERIRSEWWRRDPDAVRDYYRIQEIGGKRFWVFRRRGTDLDGWFMHGLFA